MAKRKRTGAQPALTAEQRQAIIDAPMRPLCNGRVVHSVKRWAGVFVNDNFGEGLKPRRPGRPGYGLETMGAYEGMGAENFGFSLAEASVTKFAVDPKDVVLLTGRDKVRWERITA